MDVNWSQDKQKKIKEAQVKVNEVCYYTYT